MSREKQKDRNPIEDGSRVHDRNTGMDGEILEHARQYTHPQAAPIFIYLIRWDDGQVSSVSEAAFRQGLSLVNGSE